jgi:hypothetical protein
MDAELSVEQLIRQLEERLLQPEIRKSADEVAPLLAEEFTEFGSSGRVFNKQQIIQSLQGESPVARSLTDFKTLVLAPGVVLATYRAIRHGPSEEQSTSSLRSSIWKWIDGRWQMIFHQGTPASGP